tara:strand:+ start:6092 stop:7090 length:999 start_codon:yes stop_codon:yes gene_type:complete
MISVRKFFILIVVFLLILLPILFQSKEVTYTGEVMGTTWKVTLLTNKNHKNQIQNIFNSIDNDMSSYKDNSLLNKINSSSLNTYISINKDMVNVLKESLRICKLTNGAFNISVGRSVNMWGFGPKNREINDKNKLLSKTHRHSCNTYAVEDDDIIKLQDVHLDLSAIAKGYAIDKASIYLEEHDIENYFIELGGEVKFRGKKKQGNWSIGIVNPKRISDPIFVFSSKKTEANSLATSGNYLNKRYIGKKMYSHTIDPHTNLPISDRPTLSVSVFNESAMTADALATALNVMGARYGIQFSNLNSLKTLYVYEDIDGMKIIHSTKMLEYFSDE